MPRVICTLPNASNLINGVAFIGHKMGAISEEIGQDVADAFLAIDGYLAHAEVQAEAQAKAVATSATRAPRAAAAPTKPEAAPAEIQADTAAPDPAATEAAAAAAV